MRPRMNLVPRCTEFQGRKTPWLQMLMGPPPKGRTNLQRLCGNSQVVTPLLQTARKPLHPHRVNCWHGTRWECLLNKHTKSYRTEVVCIEPSDMYELVTSLCWGWQTGPRSRATRSRGCRGAIHPLPTDLVSSVRLHRHTTSISQRAMNPAESLCGGQNQCGSAADIRNLSRIAYPAAGRRRRRGATSETLTSHSSRSAVAGAQVRVSRRLAHCGSLVLAQARPGTLEGDRVTRHKEAQPVWSSASLSYVV